MKYSQASLYVSSLIPEITTKDPTKDIKSEWMHKARVCWLLINLLVLHFRFFVQREQKKFTEEFSQTDLSFREGQ